MSEQNTNNEKNFWGQLDKDLQEAQPHDADNSVWMQIAVRPGGVWQELDDETVLLGERRQPDVWQATDEETVLLRSETKPDLWRRADEQLDRSIQFDEAGVDIWDELEDETVVLAKDRKGWSAPRLRGNLQYKPARALGWALKRVDAVQVDDYYVLKNTRQEKYLKLNEQQVFLWKLMDGTMTVQDLAVANFKQYKNLSIDWLYRYLDSLYANGFLVSEEVNVYDNLNKNLKQRGIGNVWRRVGRFLLSSEFSLKGVDRFYTWFYKLGGRVLFSWPAQIVLWAITLAGVPFFYLASSSGNYSFFRGSADSVGWGLVGLLVAQGFSIFLHESGHALTTKYYGRNIRGGGAGLYFGLPMFYMDTTDIWMEPRRARLAVTWAGPFAGFFLGSLTSLLMWAFPTAAWSGWGYQFASFCYWTSFLNLNPLVKLDGYYLLMDWLELPGLREKAIRFVREELWGKLSRRQNFTQQERIFAVYGILTIIWTAVLIGLVLRIYATKLFALF